MSGGKQTTKGVQQTMVDPNVYQALYGTGATQTIFGKKGNVKTPGTTGTGGLLQNAQQLAQQPALNPLQSQSLEQGANYLASPGALQGYNAFNQVGNSLLGFQNPYNAGGLPQVSATNATAAQGQIASGAAPQMGTAQGQIASGAAPGMSAATGQVASGPAPTMGAAQAQLSNWQPGAGIDWLAIQKSIGETFKPAGVGGGVGGLGINWQDAANKALGGQVDNPYLREMAANAAGVASENYARNIAPVTRAGARQSGMYGSSRQGIAEGIAQGDLNRAITDASTNLYGNAYESAQQRAAQMAGQMAGYDTQRDISNAQLGLQGSIANQDAALRAGQLGLSTAQGMANYDLGKQGLGLDAATLAQQGALANAGYQNQANLANLGAATDWAGLQQQGSLANAGMLNDASRSNLGAAIDWSGLQQQGSLANAGMLNDAARSNLGAAIDWSGLQQQGSLANAGMQQQANLANAGFQNDASRTNAANWLQGQGLNMEGANLAAQNQLAGAGALQGASQIPFQNLQSLYGLGTTQQQAPWNQLGQYANLLYPQANLGAAQMQNSTTSSQLGAGQVLGGALGIGMGMMGGGGLSGLLGGLGGMVAPGIDALKSFAGGGLYTPTIYTPRM